ncbi:DUF4434 domain-containing protein [Chromobacterium sp. IIBBL 290-4]|uniref:DUF4434 domain-containing protein n=1 Tax=Chromobacterium sp. IIBBL 290-4 TaxID=2953890 RepID=UPI0020B718C4|nr:DUF4434 domain-containing protein [Chromobacterium sp. IIBBL 290-4]UTH74155.1 DUF4434 domain-containing protein [Chromobacterium sp. IIBBL 290-4]
MKTWIAILLLALALPAQAMRAVFYQPQLRDQAVAASEWPGIFNALRQQGFDAVVWQWTRHGAAFADGEERSWLLARMSEARAAGLAQIVGLAADPDFFQKQQAGKETLAPYLQALRRQDASQAAGLLHQLGVEAIQGWYLPAEADDRNWRETDRQALLTDYLRQTREDLSALLPRPVYISAFFNGNAAPDAFGRLLDGIAASGVKVWLQDGAGASRLSAPERALYLDALAACGQPRVAGIVHELFLDQGHGEAFSPSRPPAAQAAASLAAAPCPNLNQLWFSLRYLPGVGEKLPL